MALNKKHLLKSIPILLLFAAAGYCGDSLSFSLDSYIASVLVNNQELKLGSFKVEIANATEIDAKRETPVSFSSSLDNSASNKVSTDIQDSVPTVTTNSSNLSTQFSKTFFFGTNVGVAYGYSYSKSNSQRLPDSLSKYHTSNINFSLTQPLLSGFMNLIKRRARSVAATDKVVSELNYKNTIISTIEKSIEAYYNLLIKAKQLSLAEQGLEYAESSITTEEELVKGGFSSTSKLIQYKTQILEKENELFDAQNKYQEQRATFLELINKVENGQYLALLTPPKEPAPIEEKKGVDTLVKEATKLRHDYLAAEGKYENAKLNLRIQKNSMLPNLNLTSNYYIYGTDANFSQTFGKIRANDYNSWSIGVNMSTPIGSKSINDKLLPYRISISEAQYKKTSLERKIRQELKSTISKLTLNYKQFVSSLNNISIAKMNFKEANQLHSKGFITLEEFLKSRKNLETSELQLFKSKCEYTTNFYKLKKSKGTLLDLFISQDQK